MYADFDYHIEISNYIHYMPIEEIPLGTIENNNARLYKKWGFYLCQKRVFYMSDPLIDR